MKGPVGQTIDQLIAALKRPFRGAGVNHKGGMVPDPGSVVLGTPRVLIDQPPYWSGITGAGGGTVTSITPGTDLESTPDPITSSGTINHAASGVSAGTYGSSALIPVIEVNARGHVVSVTEAAATGANYSDDETITGSINGSNDTFVLAHTPSPAASLQFFRNGVCLKRAVGYVLTGDTVVLQSGYVPDTGEILSAFFRY